MLDALFRFLFKYPPLMFQQGDFTVGTVAAGAAGRRGRDGPRGPRAADVSRRVGDRSAARSRRAHRIAARRAGGPRSSACSGRRSSSRRRCPQQNFLGVLVDDSRSMSIADRDGQTRAAFVQQQLSGPNAKLLAALSQRFVVRFFRFSSSSDRVASAADLKYGGTSTRLGQALERARDELSGLPLAGLVMVSRRRRHVGRRDRPDAREPQGAIDSGVHRRRRPGALRARHPGDARRDAARRPQGHVARRRRRAVADRLRRPDRAAQRRRRRAHRRARRR